MFPLSKFMFPNDFLAQQSLLPFAAGQLQVSSLLLFSKDFMACLRSSLVEVSC